MIGDSIAVHRVRRLSQSVQFQQYPYQQPNMQPYMQARAPHSGFGYNQHGTVTTVRKPEFEVRSPVNPQPTQSVIENAEREFEHELDTQTMQTREMDGKATPRLGERTFKPGLDPQSVQSRELAEQDRTAELTETISPAPPFSYRGGVSQSPVELPTRPQS